MQEQQISLELVPEDQSFPASTTEENPPIPYEPTPNNPPWNLPIAFFVWGISITLLIFFNTASVLLYALSKNVKQEEFQRILDDPIAILIGVSSVIPAHIFTLILCWYVVTQKGKFSAAQTLGSKWGGFHLGYCLLSVFVFYAIFGTLLYYVGAEDNELTKILRSSRAVVYVLSFLAVITAPVVEETVHRGILYSALQRSVGVPFAIIITSFIFAAIHFVQYQASIVALIMICLLSLGLTLIRWKSGNLLPCIVTHLIFNGLQAVGLILEPYLPQAPPEPVGTFIRLFS